MADTSDPAALLHPLPRALDWRRHALFLDFDGTLAELRDRPEEVSLDAETTELLRRLLEVTAGAVAILSGRSLADLDGMIPLPVPLSGSHGAERRLAPGAADGPAPEAPELDRARARLAPLAEEAGLLIERKPGAVALHYRNRPEMAGTCHRAVEAAADALGLRALHGNMVSEAALKGVDKGTALRDFMDRPPFAGRIPVMIGDDTTDEDGFAAAQDLGGFGLRIGGSGTAARHRVAARREAMDWLAATLTS